MVWETGVQSQVDSYQRLKKMVLDATLLNTQHNKVKIKDSGAIQGMDQHPPLNLCALPIEKGPFKSPSTKVAYFTSFFFFFNVYTWRCT